MQKYSYKLKRKNTQVCIALVIDNIAMKPAKDIPFRRYHNEEGSHKHCAKES